MKHRIVRRGRLGRSLLAGSLAVAASAVFAVSAQAVHDEAFQLDGDVSASTQTNVGGTTQFFDWDSFFNAAGGEIQPLPAGFTASGFDRDFLQKTNGSFDTSDTSIFTTGSKDTLSISPGWQCKSANNVLSKDDIMNSYAASYTAPNGDEILYFALEKNANEGNNNVGFWFLQDPVDCSTTSGTTTFTGDHQDGDLLIVSAFTNGGTVSTIDVYRWNGNDTTGSLGTTPVAHGADCGTTLPSDDACATVNAPNDGINGTITTPWLTANKDDGVGHSLRVAEFFEGGVNLTNHNLGGKCFTTFLADTRSSQSLTATLFDFSRGQLGECAATMLTQVSDAGPVLPGSAVHDTATVTGNKPLVTPTGVVTFFLCGPIATGACVTGGTQLTNTPPQGTLSGTGAIATAVSPDVNTAANPLGPGRYCFRAEWPGDVNYTTPLIEFGGENGLNECFTVKDTSSIVTAQKWLPQDSATVTTAGGTPVSGSVEFTLYESGDCSGTAVQTFTDASAPFETNNTTYYSSSITVSWRATFTPSDPNTVVGSSSNCETSTLTITN